MGRIRDEDLPEIYRRYHEDEDSYSMIGEAYGVTGSAIRSAIKRYEKRLLEAGEPLAEGAPVDPTPPQPTAPPEPEAERVPAAPEAAAETTPGEPAAGGSTAPTSQAATPADRSGDTQSGAGQEKRGRIPGRLTLGSARRMKSETATAGAPTNVAAQRSSGETGETSATAATSSSGVGETGATEQTRYETSGNAALAQVQAEALPEIADDLRGIDPSLRARTEETMQVTLAALAKLGRRETGSGEKLGEAIDQLRRLAARLDIERAKHGTGL
jgi:transposase-like protein